MMKITSSWNEHFLDWFMYIEWNQLKALGSSTLLQHLNTAATTLSLIAELQHILKQPYSSIAFWLALRVTFGAYKHLLHNSLPKTCVRVNIGSVLQSETQGQQRNDFGKRESSLLQSYSTVRFQDTCFERQMPILYKETWSLKLKIRKLFKYKSYLFYKQSVKIGRNWAVCLPCDSEISFCLPVILIRWLSDAQANQDTSFRGGACASPNCLTRGKLRVPL